MAVKKRSLSRRLLLGIPIPLLALAVGLIAGGMAWLVIDRVQTRALSNVFEKVLDNQLHQRAREALIRFNGYRGTFTYLTRLLAHHRRMANYLEPIIWPEESWNLRIYQETPPPWLPRSQVWHSGLQPSHVLLADHAGGIREAFLVRGVALPASLSNDPSLYLAASKERAFLTTLDGEPYLVVSEPVEDTAYYPMGSLVVLVPLDSDFLVASQQAVQADASSLVVIMDPETRNILSSSDPERVRKGSNLDALEGEYLVTAQSFYDYDDSDLNMMFATLLPRGVFEQTGLEILDLERRQRLYGTAAIVAVFVLLFIVVSSRISRLLRRVQGFSQKALDIKQGAPHSGNQLLILEDWIRNFITLVMKARDEMRRRHESEIEETENLRMAVMDASLDSIVTIDENSRIIDFNPTAQKMFAHSSEAVLGQNLADLVFTEQSRREFYELLDTCLYAKDPEQESPRLELQARSRDAGVFPVEVAIKTVSLADESLFTVYIHNISQRVMQEREIRALAAFPEESPGPVLRINAKGVITYANSASTPLLNYWGCRPLQTLPFYWRQQVEHVLADNVTREIEITADDGVFSVLVAPVTGVNYVNIYARDITSQRVAEEEVKRRQDELVHVSRLSTMGEMATGIAHELNQPLSAIVNFANGCARRIKLDIGGKDELLSALEQISNQASRAGQIIKRMRGMVTRQQPVREAHDLNELVEETCLMVSHDVRKHEIALERRLWREPLLVRVDAIQIEQAVLNLVRNALDSLTDSRNSERRLVISTGINERGRPYVSVEDSGSGIPPQQMEHLFDAFFTTKKTGMGMGLAITQTLVEDHRGKIYAESQLGSGSTFTIELPAYAEESSESLAS